MNPRLGTAAVVMCCVIVLASSACSKTNGTTATPSPTPTVSAGPDTVYVQDNGSKSIRVYKGGSTDNGLVSPSAILLTSDGSNPDVVYNPTFDVLWFPSAYPLQQKGPPVTTPIRIWTAASTKNNVNPDQVVNYLDGAGTAVYDSTNDLLYVANVDGSGIQIFSNAHVMSQGVGAAATITLVITDGTVSGTPRAQEMLLDNASGRLFVADEGAVVAVFDNFATTAKNAAATFTNMTVPASREIIGLSSPDGLAYNPPNGTASGDILFVGEISRKQIDVIHSASTFSGPEGHAQTIIGFGTGPTGMAFDAPRDLLFVYDPNNGAGGGIDVLPAPEVATGNVNNIANRRQFFDSQVPLSGFGLAVDTTH